MNQVSSVHLSLIIPAFNEQDVIVQTLAEAVAFLQKQSFSYEVIVVNDGSKDKTLDLVQDAVRRSPQLKCISLGENRGKGAAIQEGIASAQGERILFMDADHSVHISYVLQFMAELDKGSDIAIASIGIKGAVINDVHPKIRRWAGVLSKSLIQFLAVRGKYDTQRGFKLFTRTAAKELFSQLSIMRWGFDIEILLMAQKRKMQIKEIPVVWNNAKMSKVGFMDYANTLFELILISLRSAFGRYDV